MESSSQNNCISKAGAKNGTSEWVSNNCTEIASQADQLFYDNLFAQLYNELPEGIWIPGVNNPTDDQINFQYLLTDLCNISSNGGKCSPLLTQRCEIYSRDDAANSFVRQICGCYLPNSQYNSQVDRSCDFICSGFDSIGYFPTPQSVSPQECPGNICLISNVTIDAVDSDVGDITFQQICQDCGIAGQCRCIISDINLISQNSKVSQLNIDQNCGGSVECFQTVNGVQQSVNCDEFLGSFGVNSSTVQEEKNNAQNYIIGLSIICAFLLILFIVGVILYRKS